MPVFVTFLDEATGQAICHGPFTEVQLFRTELDGIGTEDAVCLARYDPATSVWILAPGGQAIRCRTLIFRAQPAAAD